jgi:hypothetical protein
MSRFCFLMNRLYLLHGCLGIPCREKATAIEVAFLETSEDDGCVEEVLYMIFDSEVLCFIFHRTHLVEQQSL